MLWDQLAEEIFFFQYHMRLPMASSMTLPINLRRWMIDRFIDQKTKENEQAETARRKAQTKKR